MHEIEKRKTLNEAATEAALLIDAIFDNENAEEIDRDLESALKVAFEENEKILIERSVAWLFVAKRIENEANLYSAEGVAFSKAAVAKRAKAERLRNHVAFVLASNGVEKQETRAGYLSARFDTEIADITVDDLPDDYRKETTTIEPDRKAIREKIKKGFEIPGVTSEKRPRVTLRKPSTKKKAAS